MDDSDQPDGPVIEEIREIRGNIAEITNGFSDEELLAWYQNEAEKFLKPEKANPPHKEPLSGLIRRQSWWALTVSWRTSSPFLRLPTHRVVRRTGGAGYTHALLSSDLLLVY